MLVTKTKSIQYVTKEKSDKSLSEHLPYTTTLLLNNDLWLVNTRLMTWNIQSKRLFPNLLQSEILHKIGSRANPMKIFSA